MFLSFIRLCGFEPVIHGILRWLPAHRNVDRIFTAVEDYRPGYPRFSALLATHEGLHISRRFSVLRTRLLLQKQDLVANLEAKLHKIDQEEQRPLFLGSFRMDKSIERKQILSDIDIALTDYDDFVERDYRNLQIQPARERDIRSLQNWVKGNACLARRDTEYLEHFHDLMCMGDAKDDAVLQIRTVIEELLIKFFRKLYKKLCTQTSRDPEVFIPSKSLLSQWVRAVLVMIILLFLLVPVIVCYASGSMLLRLIVIIFSVITFVGTISVLTRAKTVEVFVASAAYTTVLTVFVTGTTTAS